VIANRDRGDADADREGVKCHKAGIKDLYGKRDYEMAVFGCNQSLSVFKLGMFLSLSIVQVISIK
jgi:hypothetical protein